MSCGLEMTDFFSKEIMLINHIGKEIDMLILCSEKGTAQRNREIKWVGNQENCIVL